MTKMASMPIYGKNLKNHPLWNQNADDLKVDMQHWVLEYYQVYSNNDPGMTLIYFTARSTMLLNGKTVKQWIFQKLL